MDESGESQVSLTDPDARSMMLGTNRGTEVAYNVQISVDAKHKLIVDHEVTNECNDKNQLSSMAIRAKEVLEVESLEVVADAGYYNSQEIKDCTDQDIVPYVPQTNSSNNKKAGSLYQGRLPLRRGERLLLVSGREGVAVSAAAGPTGTGERCDTTSRQDARRVR